MASKFLKEMIAESVEIETKNGAFRRLGEFRVNKVLERIAMIGRLSNRATYEYSNAEVLKMFGTLRDSLDKAEARFDTMKEKPIGFQF